ncbi:hypothetical protein M9458_036895, partial [Cirrhinus mrigala]
LLDPATSDDPPSPTDAPVKADPLSPSFGLDSSATPFSPGSTVFSGNPSLNPDSPVSSSSISSSSAPALFHPVGHTESLLSCDYIPACVWCAETSLPAITTAPSSKEPFK